MQFPSDQQQRAAFILSPLKSKTVNEEKGFQCRNLGCKEEILEEKGGLMLPRVADSFKTKLQNMVHSRSGFRLDLPGWTCTAQYSSLTGTDTNPKASLHLLDRGSE